MNLVLFIIPSILLFVSHVFNIYNYNFIIFPILSVVFFFIEYFIANILNYKKIKYAIIPILLYSAYDVAFSFALGTNVIAFILSSLLFIKFEKTYGNSINTKQTMAVASVFFISSNLINFLMNNVFYWQVFAIQLSLSFIVSCVIGYMFENKNEMEQYLSF